MRKLIFDRTKKVLSVLFVVFFIASVMTTVSAANCWNGIGSFNTGSFNGNCNGNGNQGSFNGNNDGNNNFGSGNGNNNGNSNGNVKVCSQTCGFECPTSGCSDQICGCGFPTCEFGDKTCGCGVKTCGFGDQTCGCRFPTCGC